MGELTTIYIVEDDDDIRSRVINAVDAADDLKVLGEARSLHAARTALGRRLPDIALIDLGLPDGDGCQLIRWLTTQNPPVECLVLTVFGDEQHVVSAIEAGATGYLLKDEVLEEIAPQIRQVAQGGSPISPAVARYILHLARSEPSEPAEDAPELTPTELEILGLIAKGYSAPEIAEMTERSPATVPVHIKNIYRKLAVHSRGEAVFEALQLGLIKPP